MPPVVAFGSESLKSEIIPPVLAGEKRICLAITEPSGGSDVANLQTTAVRDGKHYIVNGSKTFISGRHGLSLGDNGRAHGRRGR